MIVMNHDDHGGNSHISDISKLQFGWKVWTNFTGGLNVCQSCQFWPKYLHDILMSILKAGILGPWGLVSPPPVPWYLSLDGAPSVKIHMCQCAIFPPHHNSPVCLNKQTDCNLATKDHISVWSSFGRNHDGENVNWCVWQELTENGLWSKTSHSGDSRRCRGCGT